ncbi:MAG: hypothetical protein J3K34DRAFT_418257, partial [Monoraphidium minutum]
LAFTPSWRCARARAPATPTARPRPPVAAALAPASTGGAGAAFLVTGRRTRPQGGSRRQRLCVHDLLLTTPYSRTSCSPAPGSTYTRGPGTPALGAGWPKSPRIVTPLPRVGCGRKPLSLSLSGVAAPPWAPGAENWNTGGGWLVTSANTPAVLAAAGAPSVHMTRKLKGSGAVAGMGSPPSVVALATSSPRIVNSGMAAPGGGGRGGRG